MNTDSSPYSEVRQAYSQIATPQLAVLDICIALLDSRQEQQPHNTSSRSNLRHTVLFDYAYGAEESDYENEDPIILKDRIAIVGSSGLIKCRAWQTVRCEEGRNEYDVRATFYRSGVMKIRADKYLYLFNGYRKSCTSLGHTNEARAKAFMQVLNQFLFRSEIILGTASNSLPESFDLLD